MRGMAKELDCKNSDEGAGELPEIHVDYCFPGKEMGFKLSILVGVERNAGAKVSVVVPQKGTTGKYASGEIVDFMNAQGFTFQDVVIKSDQENAIKYLADDVCMARTGAKTVKMLAPKRIKGSNGVVERAVQSVEGQLRTMEDVLDMRYKHVIPAEHCIVAWLVKYVSILLNKMEIGHDGKTAEQRTRGRKSTVLGLEFGEKALFKKKIETNYMEKILPRWDYGVFLGIKQVSGELKIMGQGGLKIVRSARRIPVEERWDEKALEWVKVVPWNLGAQGKKSDGEIPEAVLRGPAREFTLEEMDTVKTRPTRAYPTLQMRQEHFDKYGYTHGYPGCSSRLRGLARQSHNPSCKERMSKLLETEAFLANEDAQTEGRKQRPRDEGEPHEKMVQGRRRRQYADGYRWFKFEYLRREAAQ
jgi:hypothetical protein